MATSLYDTSPLRQTLADLIDLDYLNSSSCPMHLVVTAVDIETGALTFFENRNREEPFSLEMILASASLPPNFPMTRAKDQRTEKEGWYWDGGHPRIAQRDEGGKKQAMKRKARSQIVQTCRFGSKGEAGGIGRTGGKR